MFDINNDVLTGFWAFFSLYTLPHTSVGLTSCISIVFFSFEYFDSVDLSTACWFILMLFIVQNILVSIKRFIGVHKIKKYLLGLTHSCTRVLTKVLKGLKSIFHFLRP